jgi:hypothetical protein
MTLPASGPLAFTDIQTEFGGTNPIALNEYYAGGTYVPAGTTGTYGAVPSSGQIGVQNFYGTTAFTPIYIEDVFSTYLYTGNGTSQNIVNDIDLSTKGGLVWLKGRSLATGNFLNDTARGTNKTLESNFTGGQSTTTNALNSFNTNGFSIGNGSSFNSSNDTYVTWTLREQPKFFDIVTYTGDGIAGRTVAHSLGAVPGCIFVKKTSSSDAWAVYHRGINSNTGNGLLVLNTTATQNVNGKFWWGDNTNFIAPTSTNFTVSNDGQVNASGATYVAYIFAHNAGGFGSTGTDNVISCGSSGGGNVAVINLGYEPQWLLYKSATFADDWHIIDNMRGASVDSSGNGFWKELKANTAGLETSLTGSSGNPNVRFVSNGFQLGAIAGTAIYIAIRRGPMKVPTDATKVFTTVARTGAGGSTVNISTGFNPDVAFNFQRTVTTGEPRVLFGGKLLGGGRFETNTTGAFNDTGYPSPNDVVEWGQTSLTLGTNWVTSGRTYVNEIFKRASSFFDEVCYTGTGSAGTAITHNLTITPELLILKRRDTAGTDWRVWSASVNSGNARGFLNDTAGFSTDNGAIWGNGSAYIAPTSTTFTVSANASVNASGSTYVAYLFATCAGVSKVGSYTGNGTTQTINCGFTGGARFVLIKRTDAVGDWYVYDTARGMTTLTDPYLFVNSTAAESATLGSVTTVSTGFALNAAILAAINTSAASYIFLAIA